MVWQDTSTALGPRLDPEHERELRLIAQARAGAMWALEALIARYQPAVVRYLVRLTGDRAQAHHLAERIFLRMEVRLRGPQGGTQLQLWLLRACTEVGLDSIRHPRRRPPRLDAPPRPAGLLAARVGTSAQRVREGIERLAERTGVTSRQVRQLIWERAPQGAESDAPPRSERPSAATDVAAPLPIGGDEDEVLDARDALRHRMVRAVMAELPYGDAQCLALHLVAGLNQAEVARALGIRPSAARRHVVLGLEAFARRYESALAELGIPPELAYSPVDGEAPADEGTGEAPVTVADGSPRVVEPVGSLGQDRVIPAARPTEPATLDAPPIWQAPTPGEASIGPRASAASATTLGAAGPTLGAAAATVATAIARHPATLAEGTPATPLTTPRVAVIAAPPQGPVVEAMAVASALEYLDEADERAASEDAPLAFEVAAASLPSGGLAPSEAAETGAPAGAVPIGAPRSVPVRTPGARPPRAVPVLSAPTTPRVRRPRVVPVRGAPAQGVQAGA